MKELDDKEIDQSFDKLKVDFVSPVKRHQKIGFLLALVHPGWYFQYEMGLGKSLLSLEIINYLQKIGQIRKTVVFVPTNELIDNWIDEIEKWKFKIPYMGLKGDSNSKWEDYSQFDKGIVLVSYPGLNWMCSEKVATKKKSKLVPQKEAIVYFRDDIDCVIYDEATKLGNKDSLTFRICNQISPWAQYRYALAGRLFGRDPMLAWSQFYLVDRGDTFSSSIGFFREIFFHKKKSYWGGPYSFDYTFDKSKEDEFARICANSSLYFAAAECLDLPDVTRVKKFVHLPTSTFEYYQKAVAALRAARGNYREIQSAFIRMRQISSGFLGFVDDTTGEKAQVAFPQNPKLDLLLELIDEMPEDSKFVICHDFTRSGATISEALNKLKIKHGWLYSGTKDWEAMKRKFESDDDFKGLIIQSRKGAYGLNLQRANYMFFYESPVSVLDRTQFEARINRQGQQRKVFIYDLLCKGTADESILAFHQEGKDLFEALVANPDEVLKL